MVEKFWKIQVPGLTLDEAERLSDALEAMIGRDIQAMAIDIADEAEGRWRLEAYGVPGSDPASAYNTLVEASRRCGIEDVRPIRFDIEDQDWVAKSQADLVPVSAGRFFVHGSHDRAARPAGGVSIEIDAAQAFGTGHHATTQGCLIAFDRVLKAARPRSVLDLGCGSGILAIAAARSTRRPVLAADIDPLAVKVAAENARANGVALWIDTVTVAGTRRRAIRAGAPYDMVFANILARPLQMLAPEIRSVLASGGRAIVSGLTPDQEARVLSAYRLQGFSLERRLRIDGWSTLTLSNGGQTAGDLATRRSGCLPAPARCR